MLHSWNYNSNVSDYLEGAEFPNKVFFCSLCPTFQGRISRATIPVRNARQWPWLSTTRRPPTDGRSENWLDSGHANHMHFKPIRMVGSLRRTNRLASSSLWEQSQRKKEILLTRAEIDWYGLPGEATQDKLETLTCTSGRILSIQPIRMVGSPWRTYRLASSSPREQSQRRKRSCSRERYATWIPGWTLATTITCTSGRI